jgi:hypothetical protein
MLAGVAAGLGGCSPEENASDLKQQLAEQNQKLDEQDRKITLLSSQIQMLQQTLDQQRQPAPALLTSGATLLAVDLDGAARKEAIRQLVGFNARLSAGLGFPVYAKSLGDLDSCLAQQLLEIKNQSFVDQAKIILKQYDLASGLWDRLTHAEGETISLTPIERYNFSQCGINFSDGYPARLSDIPRFWRAASEQTQRLIDLDKEMTQDEISAKN